MATRLTRQLLNSLGSSFSKWIPGRSANLATEVAACLPVLDVIESQILDATNKGNQSTNELSVSFGAMAEQARDVVQNATNLRHDDDDAGIERIQEVVSELMAQVHQTSQSAQRTAEMLTNIEDDLIAVESCMAEIEGVANRSRMVSLNGQIEAARAGEHGQGFAVVAAETGDLAQNVSGASQRIRDVVDRLGSSLNTTCEQMRTLIEEDRKAAEVCEQRVEQMLTNLAKYQAGLESNIAQTRIQSDALADAISQSIVSLQFQDAVSQRMHHVTETLSEIKQNFAGLVDQKSSSKIEQRSQEWITKVSKSYCTDAERHVLDEAYGGDTAMTNSSNIELF